MIPTKDRLYLNTYTPRIAAKLLLRAARRSVRPKAPRFAELLERICLRELRRRKSERSDMPIDVDAVDVTEIVGWTSGDVAVALQRSAALCRMSRSMSTDTAEFLADLHDMLCAVAARRLGRSA